PGSYAISASYPGDSSYGPSATDVNFTILKAPTTLSAAPVTSSIQYGNLTQISATVLTSSDGGTPTGTVSFSLDGNALPISGATVYEGFPYEPNNSPPSFATLSTSGDAAFLTLGSHTLGA